MSQILSDINPNTFTISAFLIGLIISEDLSPAEQNSVGNWFMMIGQVLCTNSAQQQVLQNNQNGNAVINSNFPGLKKSVERINQELDKYS